LISHSKHCQVTEKMPSIALPFLRKFTRYSKYPLSLGVSDFAKYDQEGNEREAHNFPFAVTLKPVLERQDGRGAKLSKSNNASSSSSTNTASRTTSTTNGRNFSTFDSFIDEVTTIPIGTTLYDIFASPDPDSVGDPWRIQRIGRIVTTSEMIPSDPTDGIFYRHQVKEEDFQLKPTWEEDMKRKLTMDDGRTKGTVSKLLGWRLVEEDIAQQKYVDFESPTGRPPGYVDSNQQQGRPPRPAESAPPQHHEMER
jgi:hypothetical protein